MFPCAKKGVLDASLLGWDNCFKKCIFIVFLVSLWYIGSLWMSLPCLESVMSTLMEMLVCYVFIVMRGVFNFLDMLY